MADINMTNELRRIAERLRSQAGSIPEFPGKLSPQAVHLKGAAECYEKAARWSAEGDAAMGRYLKADAGWVEGI